MPRTLYAPANRCIYCGEESYASDSNRYLAEEHIIPFALNGDLVLPRASCRRCERVTCQVEAKMLKGTFLPCRTLMRLDTRRPMDRPKALPLFDSSVDPPRKVMVDMGDYPSILVMPRFDAPTIVPPDPKAELWFCFLGGDISLLTKKYRLARWSPAILHRPAYLRFLAKIAHAFATAELGLGSFEPLLLDCILGASLSNGSPLIGGCLDKAPGDPSCLHWLRVEPYAFGGDHYVAVRMRLFAGIDEAPEYLIVAGRVRAPIQQTASKQVLNTKNIKVAPAAFIGGPVSISIYGRRD